MSTMTVNRRIAWIGMLAILLCLLLSTASLHPRTAPTVQAWTAPLRSTVLSRPSTLPSQRVISTFTSDPSAMLTYRTHLELTTSPESQLVHSPTLTFTKIYVLSLPTRLDRRQQMTTLAKALGLEIEFIDASLKDEPFVKWIAERAVEVRTQRREIMAKAQGISPQSIGGLTIGNDWLVQTPAPNDTTSAATFPRNPITSVTSRKKSWVTVLEQAYEANTYKELRPRNPNLNVTAALWDSVEKIDGRQVNEGVISTFWGHTRAIRRMVERGDESALILEDDVDIEWDLERLWSRIERRLPRDAEGKYAWDVSFLGHCWGRELMKPQYLHPLLHQSTAPLCLHAYAMTARGAQNALRLLNNPWTAYQTAVDTAIPSFIHFGLLTSFSVDPPLVIQRKDGPSDIQEGVGSVWRGILMDSTVDRIRQANGEAIDELVFDPLHLDPGTTYRYGGKRKNCHA